MEISYACSRNLAGWNKPKSRVQGSSKDQPTLAVRQVRFSSIQGIFIGHFFSFWHVI